AAGSIDRGELQLDRGARRCQRARVGHAQHDVRAERLPGRAEAQPSGGTGHLRSPPRRQVLRLRAPVPERIRARAPIPGRAPIPVMEPIPAPERIRARAPIPGRAPIPVTEPLRSSALAGTVAIPRMPAVPFREASIRPWRFV